MSGPRSRAADPVPAVAERVDRRSLRPGGWVLGRLIVGYQRARAGRPSPCRFDPTCSSYALEAIEVHGAARGSWLAARRVLRCHPWGATGYDPVPARRERPIAGGAR
jgi:uncharacterized protein